MKHRAIPTVICGAKRVLLRFVSRNTGSEDCTAFSIFRTERGVSTISNYGVLIIPAFFGLDNATTKHNSFIAPVDLIEGALKDK